MKKYSTVVKKSLQKMYAENSMKTPITTLAIAAASGMGISANWLPGPGQGKGKFEINRMKRLKDVNSDASGQLGTQIVNRMNAAQRQDWETIATIISTKKDFLVAVEEGDAENFSENPGDFTSGIEQAGQFIAISDEEIAINDIITDANITKVSLGDQSAADLETFGEKVFDAIAEGETNIQQFVDEFVHMVNPVTIISPWAAKALKAYKGTVFNVDKSNYADTIIPNFTLDNSNPGYVDPHFDKFANLGAANDEKVVAIIMDPAAYFNSSQTAKMKPLDTKLLDVTFQGHSYWEAKGIVDAKRILVITAKTKINTVAKVGA